MIKMDLKYKDNLLRIYNYKYLNNENKGIIKRNHNDNNQVKHKDIKDNNIYSKIFPNLLITKAASSSNYVSKEEKLETTNINTNYNNNNISNNIKSKTINKLPNNNKRLAHIYNKVKRHKKHKRLLLKNNNNIKFKINKRDLRFKLKNNCVSNEEAAVDLANIILKKQNYYIEKYLNQLLKEENISLTLNENNIEAMINLNLKQILLNFSNINGDNIIIEN